MRKNWRKYRNYRRYKNADGSFTYVITVDGEKVEVSEELYKAYASAGRKMEYMELDLKAEQPIKDEEGVVIGLLPAREDSFERLLEKDVQFISGAPGPEELFEALEEVDELHRCLSMLNEDERALIGALYFDGLTEREYAKKIGLTQKTVNKRRAKVLAKIKKFMRT